MTRFGLYGKLVAQSGQRDALVKVLVEAAEVLETMAECELYIVNVIDDEPDTVWVTELWANQGAHEASLQDAHIKSIVQRGIPLVADMPQQVRLTPIGGKGLT